MWISEIANIKDRTKTLDIDITNYNFTFEYDLKNEANLFTQATFPEESQIESDATDFLKSMKYPEELAQGKTNIVYLSVNPADQQLIVTKDKTQANVVEVDFYRPDIENFPIVSPRYFNSQNYVILTYNQDSRRVLKAQVRFFEKSPAVSGVYPLKTGDQAWQQLKDGKGMIINMSPETSHVTVKTMLLAYLDPDINQNFMQPVFVFLGDNNFVAYIPAVLDDWLQ